MSTVEEAASLFGDADASSDIFGSTLGGSNEQDIGHVISAPATNGEVHANLDIDSLFGAHSANDDFLQQTGWPSSDQQDDYNYDLPNDSASLWPGDSAQQQPEPNNQWKTYEQPVSQVQASTNNGQNATGGYQPYQPPSHNAYSTQAYAPSPDLRSSYAPPAPIVSNSNAQYASWNGTPAATYDPYSPTLAGNNGYAPPIVTSASYDPYKPQKDTRAASHSLSPYAYPSNDKPRSVSGYAPPPLVQSAVPPPSPSVNAASYRPKALNAYDPPIPPPKQKQQRQPSYNQPLSPPPNAYTSYVPSPSLVATALPTALSPPPPRNNSSSYRPGSVDQTLPPPRRSNPGSYRPGSVDPSRPPPPASRKLTSPPLDGLPNGNDHYGTLGNGHPSYPSKPTENYAAEYVPPPPVQHDGLPNSGRSQPPFSLKPPREYPEDPEGGLMLADEIPSSEEGLQNPLDTSWVSETGTVTPRTAREQDYTVSTTETSDSSVNRHDNFFDQLEQTEDVLSTSPPPQSSSHERKISEPASGTISPPSQYSPYRPPAASKTMSPPPPRQETQIPYGYQAPATLSPVRTASPASILSQPSQYEPKQPVYDPYAPGSAKPPPAHDPYSPANRLRSASNGSILSTTSSHVDPYAPLNHLRKQSTESSDTGNYTSRYNYPERPSSTASDRLGNQNVLTAPAYLAYAPSPSLLGTNDPLGRAAARIPVFSFGFGGRVVTCFHGASDLSTGFDVALSSRQSRDLKMYSLHKIIPQSALEATTACYPGPLFSDAGSPVVGLVRPGASAQTKAKKAKVIKYLEERIEELAGGISYLTSGQLEHGRAEGKLILVKLLKVMVENDGRLSGTAEIDGSVRAALILRLGNSTGSGTEQFSTPADGLLGAAAASEASLAVTMLKPSHLEKIRDLLLRGERRQAYHYALDEKLWAHAMVIASSINKEAWQEVANEFIKSELGLRVSSGSSGADRNRSGSVSGPPSGSNGYESLRAAYSLYAGHGASAVQALLPAKPLVKIGDNLQVALPTATNFITPMSPNFPAPAVAGNIPPDVLAKWQETVAMMISNPLSPDTSSALTALGDYLITNQWIEAAHACYLLSPQTSPLGGVGSPSTRVVLLGSGSPHIATTFSKEPDPIIFSEIAEFALSLAAPTKGQEPFAGLSYLQPYRLIRANALAEMGHVQLATRYCEAIAASVSRASPYFTVTFLEQLNGLTNRLIAAPAMDKGGSWIGAKITRPSIDKIGIFFQDRISKFIAGEGENSPRPEETTSTMQPSQGPFSHYSAISSAIPSADPSPYSSTTNLVQTSGYQPPPPPPVRTGSAMALRTSTASPHLHINRSSSAMDHVRPHDRRSPVHRIGPASASSSALGEQMSAYGHSNGYGPVHGTTSGLTTLENSPTSPADDIGKNGEPSRSSSASPWWDTAHSDGLNSRTPTATTFMRVPEDETDSAESSGFISLMGDAPFSAPSSSQSSKPQSVIEEEEDEDLGFGNRISKPATPSNEANGGETPAAAKPSESEPRPELKATTSSWLSKWWKKDGSIPGPVKANLGEETAFVYDTELKKWVNKKAGAEPPKAATPLAPPNRSQTASPGRSGAMSTPSMPPGPPPPRPASAVDLTSPPRKTVPRIRSNLVPEDATSASAPPTPAAGAFLGTGPPPPARPRSSASKKPLKSRYVDIFQQPTPPPGGS